MELLLSSLNLNIVYLCVRSVCAILRKNTVSSTTVSSTLTSALL
jgi:hypothetical protein